MESITICERCNLTTSFSYLFSCSHSLCSQCIATVIAFTYIKSILTQNEFEISCSCQFGTKIITVSDLPQLLNNGNVTPTCQVHRAHSKLHCFKCELWLCENCLEKHKLDHSDHQFTQEQTAFRKCKIHEGQINDHYCHDCQQIICPSCHILKETKHANHNYQLIKEYAKILKTHIPFCDVSAQVKWNENLQRDFRTQLGCVLMKTMQTIDQLLQEIKESKLIYNKHMKQTLQRGKLFLYLLKFCFVDFSKRNVTLDSHHLKDLSTLNIEDSHLKLQDETEKKLKNAKNVVQEYLNVQPVETIQVDFQEYLKMQPFEAIQKNFWKPRDWTKATLTLNGHNGVVNSLIQLKDGRIASGSRDKTIKVWGEREHIFKNTLTLTGHYGWVCSLIQLKDGRIASGSLDMSIKIWEMKEQEFMNNLTLTGHSSWVSSLIQLKDGRIASGSGDKTIKIWEVNENEFKNTLTLTGHYDLVLSLIQLREGRIASGSWDKTIKIWEKRDHAFMNIQTLIGHDGAVISLIQMLDGRIASGSRDMTIRIWEVKEKELKNTLILTQKYNNVVYSLLQLEDGRIASGSGDELIKIWEVKEKEFKNTLTITGHNLAVCALIQMKDGRIVSGSFDKTIKIWG